MSRVVSVWRVAGQAGRAPDPAFAEAAGADASAAGGATLFAITGCGPDGHGRGPGEQYGCHCRRPRLRLREGQVHAGWSSSSMLERAERHLCGKAAVASTRDIPASR